MENQQVKNCGAFLSLINNLFNSKHTPLKTHKLRKLVPYVGHSSQWMLHSLNLNLRVLVCVWFGVAVKQIV